MPSKDRKLEVLRAIVEDFIATNEPVGSKALADRHNLGVSPATIRNDMAALEEEGLIAQPHTSAGRVPTDAGYRLFVDRLTELKPLSAAEKRAIHTFLDEAVDLDDVLHRAVRTLAQLTRNVAVVQYPSLSRSRVRHIELVGLTSSRLMLVLITDTGRVEQRVVELPAPVAAEAVVRPARPRSTRGCATGCWPRRRRSIGELPRRGRPGTARPARHADVGAARDAGRAAQRPDRAGRHRQPDRARARLPGHPAGAGGLEEQVVLLRLLDQSVATSQIVVRIGNENEHEGLVVDLGRDQRVRRARGRAGRGRRARTAADGLRPHDGPGRRGRPLRRRAARRAVTGSASIDP